MHRLAMLTAAFLLAGIPSAQAGQTHLVRTVLYRYVPDAVSIDAGDAVELMNLDVEMHSLTSELNGPDGRPLFDTPPLTGVRFLETAAVSGVPALAPGRYPFFCKFHFFMRGALEVA